jgi:hypothetical protein
MLKGGANRLMVATIVKRCRESSALCPVAARALYGPRTARVDAAQAVSVKAPTAVRL